MNLFIWDHNKNCSDDTTDIALCVLDIKRRIGIAYFVTEVLAKNQNTVSESSGLSYFIIGSRTVDKTNRERHDACITDVVLEIDVTDIMDRQMHKCVYHFATLHQKFFCLLCDRKAYADLLLTIWMTRRK